VQGSARSIAVVAGFLGLDRLDRTTGNPLWSQRRLWRVDARIKSYRMSVVGHQTDPLPECPYCPVTKAVAGGAAVPRLSFGSVPTARDVNFPFTGSSHAEPMPQAMVGVLPRQILAGARTPTMTRCQE
jgi:hypothetical protein